MRSFRLDFPAEVTAEAVAGVLRVAAAEPRGSALHPAEPLIFETLLAPAGVSWWLRLPGRRQSHLRAAIERELPGLRLTPAERPQITMTSAVELRVDSQERTLEADLAGPTMARLLGMARELGQGELLLVQWQVGAWLPRSPIPPASKPGPRSIWNLPDWGIPVRDSEQVTAARAKQAEHIFAAVGRIAVGGATGSRARSLLGSAVSAYQLLRAPGVGVSRRALPSWWVSRRLTSTRVSQLGPPIRVTATELAGVIGWPVGAPPLPGVRYQAATSWPLDERALRPHVALEPGERVLGDAAHPSQDGLAAVLRPKDGLRHLHLLGPTGVGKSTLMARLILADITAGRGVVAIDPKGDLVDDVLARLPTRRAAQVAVLDPTDRAPLGINPVAGGPGSAAGGIDGVLHVLRSIWHDSWGPRLGDVLHAGLLTLATEPGHSLVELPLLLGDPAFRRPLVARAVAQDPLGLGTFWPWFDSLSDEARAVVLAPVMNKLRSLLLRPELRAVLGQAEPRFDLLEVFTKRRALLVRLPKGQLGAEGAQLLGSLLMAQLWRLILSRSSVPRERRHPVFVYLDEFQDFLRLTLDLPDALVQARGLGVGLVLAHQHLDQLDRPVRAAVLANAGSRVAFRLDHEDASVLAKRSGGRLRPEDLSGLGAYEAYASLLARSEPAPYGSLATTALDPPRRDPHELLADNRLRWGMSAEATEARLRHLLDGDQAGAARAPLGGRPASSKGSEGIG